MVGAPVRSGGGVGGCFRRGGGACGPALPWPKQMLMIFREAPVISGPSQPVLGLEPGIDTSPPSSSPI